MRAPSPIRLHEPGDVVLLEPAQGQVLAGAGQAAEKSSEGRRLLHLPIAVRPQDEDGGLLQLAREVLEEEERGLVGGVEVVEQHDQRSLRSQGGHDGVHGIEQHDTRLVGPVDHGARERRLPVVGEPVGHLRNELTELGERAAGGAGQGRRIAPPQGRTEDLYPRPVGGRPAALPAATPQNGASS